MRFVLLPLAIANIGLVLYVAKDESNELFIDFFMGIMFFGVLYPLAGFLLGFALAVIPYKGLPYADKYVAVSILAMGILEALTLFVLAFEAIGPYPA